MRTRAFLAAAATAALAIALTGTPQALGRPGITAVPCPQQTWELGQATFNALTMHGTGDLFVPIFIEQSLERAVAAAGKDSLLAQRIYRIAGHCGFSQPEMIKAYADLAAWVHKGTKPEGDNVLGDLTDAGKRFTDPLRPNDPGGLTIRPKS
jgi:hypothetical protein